MIHFAIILSRRIRHPIFVIPLDHASTDAFDQGTVGIVACAAIQIARDANRNIYYKCIVAVRIAQNFHAHLPSTSVQVPTQGRFAED